MRYGDVIAVSQYVGQDISVSSVGINFGHTTIPPHRGCCSGIPARASASSTHRHSFESHLQGRKGGCPTEKACEFAPFQSENQDRFRKWRRHARRSRTGIVPLRHVIWRWAMQWLEFHRSCKFYHTKRPPPHPYYTQKMERNQPQRSEGWKQLPTVMPLTKRLPLESRGAVGVSRLRGCARETLRYAPARRR